jgi:hypothetical protein
MWHLRVETRRTTEAAATRTIRLTAVAKLEPEKDLNPQQHTSAATTSRR